MYNSGGGANNAYFQKLVQNFQASGAHSKTSKANNEDLNFTDKKRADSKEAAGSLMTSNVMLKTSYGGVTIPSNGTSSIMNSSISKALAH